ncbi:hypothetical protein SAMN02745751_03315 [Dethiosulfatibacter aminovorans DSM 17477]|uniref:4Fe-4S ferredoxin-type domain-containing protein n=1 Tax=Dethiosulfatibacter aminovorans DSM 17477 TaxID=1121476 RepID=A0A1M6M087_9FIRM|nr:hypothetical protein [Dethiosulfatibacter aminovorans]SHJ76818.1 hypothetical protein SAMN02745751_03315 [Dethiosulfatibacter aminovorans DSM 17477]
MEILKGCVGCRVCELLCSYNKFKKFQPSKAAIKIHNLADGFGVELFTEEALNGRFVCEFCEDKPCIKYCIELKAKNPLRDLLSVEEKKYKLKND